MTDPTTWSLTQIVHVVENSATATDLEREMARRLRAKESALKYIVDRYTPAEDSGCDSYGVDDFVIVAAAGLCDLITPEYVGDEQADNLSVNEPRIYKAVKMAGELAARDLVTLRAVADSRGNTL